MAPYGPLDPSTPQGSAFYFTFIDKGGNGGRGDRPSGSGCGGCGCFFLAALIFGTLLAAFTNR